MSCRFAPSDSVNSAINSFRNNENYPRQESHSLLLSDWIYSVHSWIDKTNQIKPPEDLLKTASNHKFLRSLLAYYLPSVLANSDIYDLSWTNLKGVCFFRDICVSHLTDSVLCLTKADILSACSPFEVLFEVVFSEIFFLVENASQTPFCTDETLFYSIVDSHHQTRRDESEPEDDFFEDRLEEPQSEFKLDVQEEKEHTSVKTFPITHELDQPVVFPSSCEPETVEFNENPGIGCIMDTDILFVSNRIDKLTNMLRGNGADETAIKGGDKSAGNTDIFGLEEEKKLNNSVRSMYVFDSAQFENAEVYSARQKKLSERLATRSNCSVFNRTSLSKTPLPAGTIKHSNKHKITNALNHFVFVVKTDLSVKETVLKLLSTDKHVHYFLHFSDRNFFRLQFRGLYYFDSSSNQV